MDRIEREAIALFKGEIEKGQQWAKEDGLDKIDMMPHKTKWEELGETDRAYWRKRVTNKKLAPSITEGE